MKHFKIALLLLFHLQASEALGWGFCAHKQINKQAVFTLPPALFTFYKQHLHFITENAVNPDNRRYVVEGEAPRHYIDLECYKDNTSQEVPQHWEQALVAYPEEVLMQHGILPWHIDRVRQQLTAAFRKQDVPRILRLSADIGHYIADAHVPLHTSENYNGQLTGQEGIHGLWETRLPELFIESYDFFVGQAAYISHPQTKVWEAITTAHQAVDSALRLEKKLATEFSTIQKYSFEQRGSTLQKVYSFAYAKAYHTTLVGQVERQMRAAIKMVGDFWLTCWMDAGQPNLDTLLEIPLSEEQLQEKLSTQKKLKVRCCGE